MMTDGECEQIVNAQVFYPLLFTLFQEGRDFIRGAGVYGGRIQSMHLKRGAVVAYLSSDQYCMR